MRPINSRPPEVSGRSKASDFYHRNTHNLYLNFGLLLSAFAVLLISCSEQNSITYVATTELIPLPQTQVFGEGSFLLLPTTKIICGSSESEAAAAFLNEFGMLGLEISRAGAANKAILFQADTTLQHKEAYQLDISEDGIVIAAANSLGFLHGAASLLQLVLPGTSPSDKTWCIQLPAMTLTDYPNYKWRGLLLDCCRHFMTKDFVKRYIDLLALYKMNVLHWHLTEDQGWRIEIEKYPKLAEIGAWRLEKDGSRYGGFYTKAEIREVVTYAAARGITVVPEIELPGHSQAALAAYPQFSCNGGPHLVETEWGVFKEIYCAGNDSTFLFLQDVLAEVMELFPSEYIHIGGDEAPKIRWEQCAKCQRRIKSEGLTDEHELQSYFIQRIEKYLAANGKKLIGWDEILEGGLAPGATVQSWRGFDGALAAAQSGHDAIVSPTSHAYFDYDVRSIDVEKVYSFVPIPETIRDKPELAKHILGGECNMWTEHAPQEKVDSKVFPRILAMAEVLWTNNDRRNFEDFSVRMRSQYALLDQLGVDYGYEKVPVELRTEVERNKLRLELIPGIEGTQIFYTLDETNPTIKSASESPIEILQDVTMTAGVFRAGKQIGEALQSQFSVHKALASPMHSTSEFHDAYAAGGKTAMTDGKRGSTDFRDGNWQGHWGKDFVGVVDLGDQIEIKQVGAGFYQYNNAWIFLPTSVKFELSSDNKSFLLIGESKPIAPPDSTGKFVEYIGLNALSKLGRYVRISARTLGKCPAWHDAAGSDAWIFIDEIIVR